MQFDPFGSTPAIKAAPGSMPQQSADPFACIGGQQQAAPMQPMPGGMYQQAPMLMSAQMHHQQQQMAMNPQQMQQMQQQQMYMQQQEMQRQRQQQLEMQKQQQEQAQRASEEHAKKTQNIFDPFAAPAAPSAPAAPLENVGEIAMALPATPNAQVAAEASIGDFGFGSPSSFGQDVPLAGRASEFVANTKEEVEWSEEEEVDDDLEDDEYAINEDDIDDEDDDEYNAVFTPDDAKLGVLIGDMDQEKTTQNHGGGASWGVPLGEEKASVNQVMAKMVQHGSAAFREGVTEGSVLMAVNGESIEGKPYNYCSKLIREIKGNSDADLVLRFRRPESLRDGAPRELDLRGHIMARVMGADGGGVSGLVERWKAGPGVASWSDRFFIWSSGNSAAQRLSHATTLALFKSEAHWQEFTVEVHAAQKESRGMRQDIADGVEQIRTDLLGLTLTSMKKKHYKAYGELYYFALKNSNRLVVAKFAGQESASVQKLHSQFRRVMNASQHSSNSNPGL